MVHWHIEIRADPKSDRAGVEHTRLEGFYLWRGVANSVAAAMSSELNPSDRAVVIDCPDHRCKTTFWRD